MKLRTSEPSVEGLALYLNENVIGHFVQLVSYIVVVSSHLIHGTVNPIIKSLLSRSFTAFITAMPGNSTDIQHC